MQARTHPTGTAIWRQRIEDIGAEKSYVDERPTTGLEQGRVVGRSAFAIDIKWDDTPHRIHRYQYADREGLDELYVNPFKPKNQNGKPSP